MKWDRWSCIFKALAYIDGNFNFHFVLINHLIEENHGLILYSIIHKNIEEIIPKPRRSLGSLTIYAKIRKTMVLILDGNSEIDAHVLNKQIVILSVNRSRKYELHF